MATGAQGCGHNSRHSRGRGRGQGRARQAPPVHPHFVGEGNSQCNITTSGSPSIPSAVIQRRVRGQTKATKTWQRNIGERSLVEVDSYYGFVGKNSRELKTFISSITNSQVHMPFVIQKPDLTWEAVDWTSPLLEPYHQRALKNIFGRFRFIWVGTDDEVEDEWTKSCLLKQMDKSWGDMKATCHNKVNDKSTEEKLAAKPDAWTTDYWNALLFHFESDRFLEASARGRRARALVTCISHAGAHGASEWSYEQSQITGIEPSPVERIDYLHRRVDGTPTSELVDQRSERMHAIVLEAEAAAESQGTPLTSAQKFQIANRAVVQVYGRHSHGRVRGGGSNITPSQYNQVHPPTANRSTQSTTTAAASSSVEEDARRYHELRRQIEDNSELRRYMEESGISVSMGLFRGNGSQ